ncbi:PREDICTED: DNA topoisomerase I, mitochondrial isoform X2 [Galeopterus variegatus]|uniref:DNA topoisomerase I n=1 Tax=Galeopterus variegatus TaxID=482537 RepID=A0ABM0QTT3_GALVR|nr:PREDICTED: DNA topoisomerase I, mitochondrial isoform X2 [Galeopterus variegatus]
MGDAQGHDFKQFSVKDKAALVRKGKNTERTKLENSKKQKVKEPNQENQGRCGEEQSLKEESKFSVSRENPGQDDPVNRSAQIPKPVKTDNHRKLPKKKGQVARPRGGPADELKMALSGPDGVSGQPSKTQEKRGKETVLQAVPGRMAAPGGDGRELNGQGENHEKSKSKQEKGKGENLEERGLLEKPVGIHTKAARPEEGRGDSRSTQEDLSCREQEPKERGPGEERARKEGQCHHEKGTQDGREAVPGDGSEQVPVRKTKPRDARKCEELLERKQLQDDDKEGTDVWAVKMKTDHDERLAGGTRVSKGTRNDQASGPGSVVSRRGKKRRVLRAAEEGAGKSKERKLEGQDQKDKRSREREAQRRSELSEGAAEWQVQGQAPAGTQHTSREESHQRGVKRARGREDVEKEEEPVGAGVSSGNEKKVDQEGERGQQKTDGSRWRWWEEEKSQDVKWTQLEHKGPYFAPPYEPLPDGVHFFYDGKPMKLSLAAEEVATFYGKMLDHEYTTKEVFQNNFFSDWRKEMTVEEREVIKHLDKCDFTEIHRYFVDKAAARKALPWQERQKLKEEAEKLQQEFGYCILDGHREKIGNFKTEPPGLFRGRGDHPKMGMLKRRVMPEDVVINCSRDSKIPEPPAGHQWREVRSDNTVTWLAAWTENVQNSIKYIMLNPSSKLKGEKDWQKYETARRLKGVVEEIRSQYRADWKSQEMKRRQQAVALYFIDKLALRAGNEKEGGETADTVGCCSLRVEHVRLHPEAGGCKHVVELDFLGKDSIRYYNRVPVEKPVYKNLQLFMENKDPGDDLFDRLTTATLNKHLQDLMCGLTAKVFRTYNASITLQEQLRELTSAEDSTAAKILSYSRANRAVAILCNHQRATPKTFEKSMKNLQAKIEMKKEQVAEAKVELKKATADFKTKGDGTSRSFLEKKQRLLEKLEEQLVRLHTQATEKEENKQVALGTSKLNYLDPRISIAWCKRFRVPVEKIYNKTQREKFAWALAMADEDFEF